MHTYNFIQHSYDQIKSGPHCDLFMVKTVYKNQPYFYVIFRGKLF